MSAYLILLKKHTQKCTYYRNKNRKKRCLVINTEVVIKGKVDASLGEILKEILIKKNMTQQDLIETTIKEFVLKNLYLVINKETKGSK